MFLEHAPITVAPVNLQLNSQTTSTLIFSDLYSFAWHLGWQHLLSHSLNFHGLAYLCILLERMWVAYLSKQHFQPSSPPFKFQTSWERNWIIIASNVANLTVTSTSSTLYLWKQQFGFFLKLYLVSYLIGHYPNLPMSNFSWWQLPNHWIVMLT